MKVKFVALVIVALIVCTACPPSKDKAANSGPTQIIIDGSSTVYPVSQAVAEEFMNIHENIQVSVGISGTGGGFKKFSVGETDISAASRPIRDSEVSRLKENAIGFIELPVAYDGLSVVVNPKNDWVDSLTVDELKLVFAKDVQVKNWSEVRPGFPEKPISIYAPDTDSGTFDYFCEAITGKGNHTADYQPSADDNMLVTGVSGDENAIGYFGFSYYHENKDKLRVVKIDDGNGPVEPTTTSINDGTYSPLSRPIFIYISTVAIAEIPEITDFIEFYLTEAPALVREVGYVDLPASAYSLAKERFQNNITGSVFNKEAYKGLSLVDVLSK